MIRTSRSIIIILLVRTWYRSVCLIGCLTVHSEWWHLREEIGPTQRSTPHLLCLCYNSRTNDLAKNGWSAVARYCIMEALPYRTHVSENQKVAPVSPYYWQYLTGPYYEQISDAVSNYSFHGMLLHRNIHKVAAFGAPKPYVSRRGPSAWRPYHILVRCTCVDVC